MTGDNEEGGALEAQRKVRGLARLRRKPTLRRNVGIVLMSTALAACTSDSASPDAPSSSEEAESSASYEPDVPAIEADLEGQIDVKVGRLSGKRIARGTCRLPARDRMAGRRLISLRRYGARPEAWLCRGDHGDQRWQVQLVHQQPVTHDLLSNRPDTCR